MDILKTYLTPNMIEVIVTMVIVPFLISLIQTGSDHLKAKANNNEVSKYIDLANDAVQSAVTAVAQTVVDVAKASGTFDQAAREEAFLQAKQRALSIMAPATKTAIQDAYGDLNAWLDNKIENYVRAGKDATKPG